MGKTVAMILAGGRGKRMEVLCHVRPKPALPFAGRFKVIDFTLSNCVYSGIKDIAVLTDYQRSGMAKYLQQWCRTNSVSTFSILEPESGSYRGTADAVYQNLGHLDKIKAENALILAGDHIYKMDYADMLDFHHRTGADVTVGVIRVPFEDTSRFGTLSISDDKEIQEFVEKSRNSRSNLASMGIYVFNKDVLAQRLTEDAARLDSAHDFGYAILPGMVGRDRVMAYEFKGYWQDIGTPEAYYEANMELLCAHPSFSLNHYRTVLSRHMDMQPAEISGQGTVINSLLSPGCVVKGHVENSVLSPGVFVDRQAEVRNSVLMPDVSVGFHSVVDTCIIDEGVRIEKLCYLGFGKSMLGGNLDITVLGKGVYVPSHTAIGRDCRILPHVDASVYKGNLITSGTTLSQAGASRKYR